MLYFRGCCLVAQRCCCGLEMQLEGQNAYPAFPGTRGRISSTKDTSKNSVIAVMDSHWAVSRAHHFTTSGFSGNSVSKESMKYCF